MTLPGVVAGIAIGITVDKARRVLVEAFRNSDLDSPETDARVLLGHALGLDRSALTASPDRPLSAPEAAAVMALAARRLSREPVAHIVGAREFWSLDLRVTPDTLVPRPETETVVEAALAALDRTGPRTRPWLIADLGTGTGALLLALLQELPQAFGIATDLNPGALAVARDNATRHRLERRAAFVLCDFGTALAGPFGLVVSNPPYISSEEVPRLAPEVKDHDPLLALDGGTDGLDAYRAIARDAGRLLAPTGMLVVELGAGQAPDVAGLFTAAGLYVETPARPDLAGIPRAMTARLPMHR
jgi:release factor glutamine methyltransferase